MWLEDVFVGALAPGVNVRPSCGLQQLFTPLRWLARPAHVVQCGLVSSCSTGGLTLPLLGVKRTACVRAQAPTALLLNVALVGCIAALGVLLALALQGTPALVPHVAFLLVLAAGLLVLINWHAPLLTASPARPAQLHTARSPPPGVPGLSMDHRTSLRSSLPGGPCCL